LTQIVFVSHVEAVFQVDDGERRVERDGHSDAALVVGQRQRRLRRLVDDVVDDGVQQLVPISRIRLARNLRINFF
jgi:hypothetical protein